jgi:uncharacterized membrane protein
VSGAAGGWLLSKHRLEALTDGIYAVAMTLLVLELRVPEGLTGASDAAFVSKLDELTPKFIAWILSFLILSLFWVSHQRAFHFVRHVDEKMLRINILSLLLASLLPFSSALLGEQQDHFISHVFYDLNMAGLALATLWQVGYLERHPELCDPPVPADAAHGARVRGWVLVGLAMLSMGVAAWNPHIGTLPFILMIFLRRPLARAGAGPAATAAKTTEPPK